MLGNLFRQRSHYVYNYQPRYYNERKERLKATENSSESQLSFSNSDLKSKWGRAKKPIADRNSNKRLAIIITILVGIVAYIFQLHTLF